MTACPSGGEEREAPRGESGGALDGGAVWKEGAHSPRWRAAQGASQTQTQPLASLNVTRPIHRRSAGPSGRQEGTALPSRRF